MRWSVILAVVLPACGGSRMLSGPTVSVPGFSVRPEKACIDAGELTVRLEIDNAMEQELSFEPQRVTLVGPDGTTYAEGGGGRTCVVAAGSRRRIGLTFVHLDWKVEHAPGFYLLLDGFLVAGAPLELPALPLGHPVTEPDGRVRVRRVIVSEP